MENNHEEDEKMEHMHAFVALKHLVASINYACALFVVVMHAVMENVEPTRLPVVRSPHPFQTQLDRLNRLFRNNDNDCYEQLRMDRWAFARLCTMTREVGLTDSRYVILEEKVAMFLWVIAHHEKNRVVKFDFLRSGQTVSRYFNDVLKAVLRLQDFLLKAPEPIPADYPDERWTWFQVIV